MDSKDDKINPDEDYRCSVCGILLSSEYAGDDNGEFCEEHIPDDNM